ncbi:hypothetical protein PM082_007001 [Marasmius tenuissimus]|nr:hypothetical protein PM082_007001 [Marasmius tenuissimus]
MVRLTGTIFSRPTRPQQDSEWNTAWRPMSYCPSSRQQITVPRIIIRCFQLPCAVASALSSTIRRIGLSYASLNHAVRRVKGLGSKARGATSSLLRFSC